MVSPSGMTRTLRPQPDRLETHGSGDEAFRDDPLALRRRFADPPAWVPETVVERRFVEREPALALVEGRELQEHRCRSGRARRFVRDTESRPAGRAGVGVEHVDRAPFGVRERDGAGRVTVEDRVEVVLTGRVTAAGDGALSLSRWVPGCCSADAELVVEVRDASADVGQWLEVTGRPDGDAVPSTKVRLREMPGVSSGMSSLTACTSASRAR